MAESPSVPTAVQDCHALLRWMVPHLDKFPRSRRFTLGERLESGLLQVLECLVRAAYARRNHALLADANATLDVVRHLWRLCFELEVIPVKRYEHGARMMVALGRQIGAWRGRSLPVARSRRGRGR